MDLSKKGRKQRKTESIVQKGFLKVTTCADPSYTTNDEFDMC